MFCLIVAICFRIESLNFIIFRYQCQTMDLDTYSYLISTDYLSRNWIPTALYDQNYSCKFCKCNKMNYHWRLAVVHSPLTGQTGSVWQAKHTMHVICIVRGHHNHQMTYCPIYSCLLLSFRLIRRTKTKFFNGNHLVWDEDSSAGKYVRDNCKALQVSF